MMVDSVDFSILKVVHDNDTPVWKKRIHDLLHDRYDELPSTPAVSLQTVGRRVDRLHAEDYLHIQISPMSQTQRRLVLAYSVTEAGRTVMRQKREELLGELLHIDGEPGESAADRRHRKVVVAGLVSDELGLATDTRNTLLNTFTLEEMAALYSLYRTKQAVQVLNSRDTRHKLMELAGRDRSLASILGSDILSPEFRSLFQAGKE